MKRIFIFPTIEEAKPFILTEPRDPVFISGVGMAEVAACTIRAVKTKKPQLAVLCGIAGACDKRLKRGEVVEVVTERIAALPERYAREYKNASLDIGLRSAAGVTVNRSGECAVVSEGDLPLVENMEGAAFFAVCEALGVACRQIRSISNYTGEPFGQWAVEEAVANLTESLTKIFEHDE